MTLAAPLLVQSLHDSKEAIRVGRQLLTNLQEQQWLRFESKADRKSTRLNSSH